MGTKIINDISNCQRGDDRMYYSDVLGMPVTIASSSICSLIVNHLLLTPPPPPPINLPEIVLI
jgi:hypothetical protein